MMPNFNSKQPHQNTTNGGQNVPTSAGNNARSVPISIYRELAAELQATRVMLESLNNQNQQLSAQNQQLRREIEKVVHSALYLKQVADASVSGTRQADFIHPEMRSESSDISFLRQLNKRPLSNSGLNSPILGVEAFDEPEPVIPIFQEKLVTEQVQGRYRRNSKLDRNAEINGWWLTLAIVLIVVTAFGAGYLFMRPLLINR
jgi:cobalamin biosynthesis Mg chelatase CobN